MSAGHSRHSVASNVRRQQEAKLAAPKERERAAAETVAAAARASRLAAAELAAARAEVEAEAAAAAAEADALRSNASSSVCADDSTDADLKLLAMDASRERAARWAAEHAYSGAPGGGQHGGGVPGGGQRAGGAPGGGLHGGGAPGGAHGGGAPGGGAHGGGAPAGGAHSGGAPGGGAHGSGAPGGGAPDGRALEAQRLRERDAQLEAEMARDRRHGRLDGECNRRRDSLSPDRRQGHYGVQAIVRDGGWSTLTKTNYVKWAAIMRIRLQVRHLWEAVYYFDVDFDEDRRAMDALIAAVPPKMQFSLTQKETAKEAWDAIAAARIGSDRARNSTLQTLRKKWENLAFKPGEDLDDFALHLNTLMSIEEVIGRLKIIDADEPQLSSDPVTIGGQFHFAGKQWKVYRGDGKKGESSSTTDGHKRGKPRKA
jgi:hypothetical protein